jgi:hypothetical protein
MASSFEQFLNRINACVDTKEWAKNTSIASIKQGWDLCPEPGWMLVGLASAGHQEVNDRRARKWVHQCLLLVQSHLKDPRSVLALRVLENYSKGTGTPQDVASACTQAKAAVEAQLKADADAPRASQEFHAARAVASSLGWSDPEWSKHANEATFYSATAVAQQPDGTVDREKLIGERQKQADLLRSLFAPDIAGLIADLERVR